MKVKVEMELDIPDELIGDDDWAPSMAAQAVHDNFTNFAVCRHFKEQLDWVVRSQEEENSRNGCDKIAERHELWANIILQADVSVTVGDETLRFDKKMSIRG